MPLARPCLALACSALLCTPAFAAANATSSKGPWSGSAAFGGVVTTGNSQTSSLDGKFSLGYASGPWDTDLHIEVLHASDSNTTTANRQFGEINTRRTLNATTYAFGNVSATHDTFSGYRYQTSAAAGLGRKLIHTKSIDLSAEIGPGVRQSQIDGGDVQRNAIARARGKFVYRFTDKAHFDQTVTAIAGGNNTELDSVTSLTTDISGALALKVSYTVMHNTKVPLGRKKTDTYTSINLVYAF